MTAMSKNLEDSSGLIQANDVTESSRDLATASQWRLMWLVFKQHRLAVYSGFVVLFLYLIALFSEFFAPFDPYKFNGRFVYHPPQLLRLIDRSEDGSWSIRCMSVQ